MRSGVTRRGSEGVRVWRSENRRGTRARRRSDGQPGGIHRCAASRWAAHLELSEVIPELLRLLEREHANDLRGAEGVRDRRTHGHLHSAEVGHQAQRRVASGRHPFEAGLELAQLVKRVAFRLLVLVLIQLLHARDVMCVRYASSATGNGIASAPNGIAPARTHLLHILQIFELLQQPAHLILHVSQQLRVGHAVAPRGPSSAKANCDDFD